MANTGLTFEFKLATKEEIMQKRGLESGGVVQQIVDSEVMRYMDPYIPLASGAMRDSMIIDTIIGSGEIQVNTPYAHRRLLYAIKNGLRGPNYFERMKADHKDDILRAAAKAAGGGFK